MCGGKNEISLCGGEAREEFGLLLPDRQRAGLGRNIRLEPHTGVPLFSCVRLFLMGILIYYEVILGFRSVRLDHDPGIQITITYFEHVSEDGGMHPPIITLIGTHELFFLSIARLFVWISQ